ncbi:hypothetical protein HZA55_08110 [Candidatus Poribacteria bacterium]|nr:hypothetical protein [Candidatus Poribacteria bacterium]
MRFQQKYIILILLFLFELIIVYDISAAEIHGRASSQYLWYTDIVSEKKQSELEEYLNISLIHLDKNDKFSIHGYGRFAYSVNDPEDNSDKMKNRLYSLYLDGNNLINKKMDFKLGRQFVNYTAGSSIIDGGQIELKNIGPIALSFMGGRSVFFDLTSEETNNNNTTYGAAAYLNGFKSTDAEISYFRKDDEDGIARDFLGAYLKQYLFNSVRLYGNTRYDLVGEVFSEILAGAKFYPNSDLILTGEHYQSYPVFDNTSIYAIFAVDLYKEDLFRIDYTINDKLSTNASYTREDYESDNANVFEIGLGIHPTQKIQLNLNYEKRNGYGGKLNGGMFDIAYEQNSKLNISTGIHYDVYERERLTGEETARKYWIGSNYKFTNNISGSLRVEDNINTIYKDNWQGRAVINYDF